MAKEEMKSIPVGDAYQSPTNPKGRTSGPEFDELVASVRAKGVLVPILARRKAKGAKMKYEVVAGNRRFQAAIEAGLTEIPARVVDMTDEEAREAQVIENLQRKDIEPLEEAEHFRALAEKSKDANPAADIAARVGKSERYVRDRMVLSNLTKEGKKMLEEKEITVSVASLIGRLDPKMQKEALEFAGGYGEPDLADVRSWIQDHVYVDLSNRPWKDDEQLMAAMEGCEECKGKASASLFGKSVADECSNPKCWATRMAAYIQKKKQEDPELVEIYGGYGRSSKEGVLARNQYHEAEGKEDKCEHLERAIVVEGTGMGHVKKICRTPECKTHWATSNPSGSYKPTAEERAARKKQLAKEREAKEKRDAKVLKAIAKVKMPMSEKHLDVLFDVCFRRFGFSYIQPVAARHGIKAVKKERNGYTHRDLETPVREYFEGKGKNGKLQFIFEVGLEAVGGSGDGVDSFIKKL